MAHQRRRQRQLGLLLAGMGLGLLLLSVVLYVWLRAARRNELAETLIRQIDLPSEAMELEALEGDSVALVAVRDVVVRDRAGDTIVAAPVARMRVRLASFAGDEGPIVVDQVRLERPYLNVVQRPDGEINLAQAMVVTAGGQEVDTEEARPVLLRDVRIAGGTVRLLTPYAPDSLPFRAPGAAEVRTVSAGGRQMRVRWVRGVEASLPTVRFGGGQGWRVEVGQLAARLTDPEVRVDALAGFAESDEAGRVRFAVNTFRTGASSLSASGVVRMGGEQLAYDVEAVAAPAAFADLQWFVPGLPSEGEVRGAFDLESRRDGRVTVRGREVVVTALGSRASGYFSAVVGGDQPASFGDTRIALEPLRLESLGLGDRLPYDGEVRGVIASSGGEIGGPQPARVDLTATVTPRGGGAPASTVRLEGPVTAGGEEMVRFAGTQLSFRPLHLAALRPFVTEQPERLRGSVTGSVLLSGSASDLHITGGTVAYDVGGAPTTRLVDIRLRFAREPVLTFDFSARAEPLALGTLAELFPQLPFRAARFSGPFRVVGTTEQFRIDADLAGSAGGIAVQGVVSPGTPLRFDLTGRVRSFSAEEVLTASVPVEGPVTGTFAAAGSTEDLAFNVDLAQPRGSFALQGRFQARQGASPLFEVAGTVNNFNLGAAIGRPRLFPSRLTGRLDVRGGGGAPYRFDVDLRGGPGAVDVEGFYAPGAVPSYAVSGVVTGLNLRQLPGGERLPQSDLRGRIELEGQGTTLETLAGRLRFSATGSTLAGMPLESMLIDAAVSDGVLRLDTLDAALAGSRLSAEGTWGLTRPVTTEPLTFRLVSRDLARLRPLLDAAPGLQPPMEGSFVLQGAVAGSVRSPLIDATFRGQNLRYRQWRAERLEVDADLALTNGLQGVQGELTLNGDRLELGAGMTLDSVRLALNGTQDRLGVNLVASREGTSDIQVAGVMELQGRVPQGVLLDSLMLRAGDIAWQLQSPTALRWIGDQGVRVDNLFLRRVGDVEGWVRIDGTIPPAGNADLEVEVRNLDLELARRLLPTAPDMAGLVSLDLTIQGPIADPELFLQGRATGVRYSGLALDSLVMNATYDERRMQTGATLWNAGEQTAVVEAVIPMTLSVASAIPRFELLRNAPVSARVVADSLPVALLAGPVQAVEEAGGVIAGEVTLRGTIDNPEVGGFATVTDGVLALRDLGVRYERINGRLILDEQTIVVDSLTAWSDGDAVVNGSIGLDDLTRPSLYLTTTLTSFHAIDNEDLADLTLDGTVRLEGRMPDPVLSGDIRVVDGTIFIPSMAETAPLEIADVDVGEIGVDTTVTGAAVPTLSERIRISELNVSVEEGVWLESDEARVQIRGDLVVVRTGPEYQFFGTMQAVRGTYALTIGPLVREFEVVGGSIRFFGTPDFNPELDITAQHEVRAAGTAAGTPQLTVLVHLTGTLEYPRVRLTSNTRPPLPESELLSYLVFGQPSFRLDQTGGAFAQQVLVQELLGGLLIQELGQLGLPCQYFRLRGRPNLLNSDPLRSTSVECGVQLAEDVFLTLETGVIPTMGGGTGLLGSVLGVSLDWEVNRFVTARLAREPVQSGLRSMILTPVEVRYQWSADVKGTWEFGRPREEALPEPPPADQATVGAEPPRTPPEE